MNAPLFSPSSVFWRVNREIACGLAGPRAVLMQIAHPLVAAGVAEHSNFREHRLLRLYRTSIAAAAITFGSRGFALRAVRSINKKHQRVHGVLPVDAGPFPAGTPYDANDPELKLWVLNTITDSTLRVYESFVAPLSLKERESYYADSLTAAELFGIPSDMVPPTYADFLAYMNRMLESDAIQVSDQAREIAKALFSRSPSGRLLLVGSVVGIGLLPERLQQEFGFHWTPRRERWIQQSAAFAMSVRRHVPAVFCCNPFATLSGLRAR
jgi:uncharacterized protein (DUF2236 family)